MEPPADPFGPVDQDPDAIREEACRLVSSNKAVCSPPKPVEPPSGTDGNFDLNFLSVLLWTLFVVAAAVLLYVLIRWLFVKTGRFERTKRGHDNDNDNGDELVELDAVPVGDVQIDSSRRPLDWRAEAEQHRQAGRFRDALRCRYRALVGDLARRGLIDEIPGRTTGEERAQLGDVAPAAAGSFDAAADLFDGAWYGRRDVDRADDDRFQVLEGDVLTAVRDARR